MSTAISRRLSCHPCFAFYQRKSVLLSALISGKVLLLIVALRLRQIISLVYNSR
jgi:hypothetical protein